MCQDLVASPAMAQWASGLGTPGWELAQMPLCSLDGASGCGGGKPGEMGGRQEAGSKLPCRTKAAASASSSRCLCLRINSLQAVSLALPRGWRLLERNGAREQQAWLERCPPGLCRLWHAAPARSARPGLPPSPAWWPMASGWAQLPGGGCVGMLKCAWCGAVRAVHGLSHVAGHRGHLQRCHTCAACAAEEVLCTHVCECTHRNSCLSAELCCAHVLVLTHTSLSAEAVHGAHTCAHTQTKLLSARSIPAVPPPSCAPEGAGWGCCSAPSHPGQVLSPGLLPACRSLAAL